MTDRVLRLAGAALLLAGGAVHVGLSLDGYGTDRIVDAFAVNAGASSVVAAFLVLRRDLIGPIAGLAVTASTLVAFGLSRQGDGILGLREVGLTNPAPDAVATLVVELAALVVLGVVAARWGRATSSPRS